MRFWSVSIWFRHFLAFFKELTDLYLQRKTDKFRTTHFKIGVDFLEDPIIEGLVVWILRTQTVKSVKVLDSVLRVACYFQQLYQRFVVIGHHQQLKGLKALLNCFDQLQLMQYLFKVLLSLLQFHNIYLRSDFLRFNLQCVMLYGFGDFEELIALVLHGLHDEQGI